MPERTPVITGLKQITDNPEINRKIEFELVCGGINGDYYNPESVQIVFEYSSGSGNVGHSDAFYIGDNHWLIRISVSSAGEYSGKLSVFLNGSEAESRLLEFCVADSENRRGVLSVELINRRVFAFENGELFNAIGHNLAWGDKTQPVEYYREICKKLHRHGANWTRLWLTTEWFLSLISKNAAPADFSASLTEAETLDRIMEIFEQYGIYVQLVLFNHSNLKEKTGPVTDRNWHDFSFNSATAGGYLESPSEFFTDERAKTDVKKYLRYVVSRWGYSCNILCYELFNEAGAAEANSADITDWHGEMTEYLRGIDSRKHMITTSSATPVYPLIYDDRFDFINHHRYGNISNVYQIISDVAWCAECYGKPVLLSECGAAWTADSAVDRTVIHQHVWAGLMCGSAGTGCQWYWEKIDTLPNEEGYKDYLYAAEFAKRIPWNRKGHRFITGKEISLNPKSANVLGYINNNYAYLWFYDPAYTFTYRNDRAAGNTGIELSLKNGDYSIVWYDTEKGIFSKPELHAVTNGILRICVPEFHHDIALSIEGVK